MKKTLLTLIAGLVIGGAGTWWMVRPHADAKAGAAAAKPEAKGEEAAGGGPKLSPEQQASAGLATVTPASVNLPAEAHAYGRVLDLTPLIAAATEVATAEAALTASEKEFNRVRALHADGENASAQAVETAEAAAQRNRIAVLAARAKLAANWGRELAEKVSGAWIERILKNGSSLVRIDATVGQDISPIAARVGGLTDDSILTGVDLLGPAPSTDAQLQGRAWFALWQDKPLPSGTMVRATLTLPGDPQPALILPRAAFVQHEGSTWVYVQTATGSYERRRVEISRPLTDGYAIAGGVSATDHVVNVGAQQLLSTELNASTEEPD